MLGKAPEQLDREFRAFAEKRLARYSTQFVPISRGGSIALAQAAVERSPDSALTHTALARALLRRGRGDRAKIELTRALALDPTLADARFLDAQLGAHDEPAHAAGTLQKLIAEGKDGYAVEMLLAQALGSNDEAGAKQALASGDSARPFASVPALHIGRYRGKCRRYGGRAAALCGRSAALEQHEPKVYQRLLRRLLRERRRRRGGAGG